MNRFPSFPDLASVALALLGLGTLNAAPPPDELTAASRRGDITAVKKLLAEKADAAANDNAAARQANLSGHAEVLRLLRAAGGSEKGSSVAEKNNAAVGRPASPGLSRLLPAAAVPARQAGAKLRIAIVAGDEMQPAADLLTASLGGAAFDLIERAELQRVLAEHQLTAQFGADGARAAEVGALLGADALVLLRKVQFGEMASAEMRFVRVSPGIVLDSSYRAWPLADAPAWAADAAARLTQFDPQFRDAQAIAIATAPFRPLTDTPAATSLARECLLLLNDRLAHQPGLVLLEREAVDLVAREQGIGKAGKFWAGSYLLDGTVESPVSETGPTAITLRLAPIGPGEVKTFTARGPRAELPRLVADITTQATTALKLRAAPPSDLQAEAQRHFDEARNLSAVGLPLAAYRAAETAAAFGLNTDEFNDWHLDTVIGLIAWHVERLGRSSGFDELRANGWSEAWIEERMGGEGWMRPVEWCDLGVEAAQLWRRSLLAALRAGDAKRATALLIQNGSPLGGAFAVYYSLDLAATTLDHHDMHRAICDEVRAALEEARALADANPALAASADALAFQTAGIAPVLYRDSASLTAAFAPLLSRKFSTDPLGNRISARMLLLGLDGNTDFPSFMAPPSFTNGNQVLLNGDTWTPHGPEARAALRKALAPRDSVEDELTLATLNYLASKDPNQQRALSDKLFDLLSQRRQFFVETPGGPTFFSGICQDVSRFGNAPKFRWHSVDSPQSHVEHTPEMMALRRKIFILAARDSAHPSGARTLLDKYYHPPGEDAQEIARLEQRTLDDLNGRLGEAPKPVVPPTPRPKLRGTPTYAKYPAFKVTRRWTTEPTPRGLAEDFYVAEIAFDPETKSLLLFGMGDAAHGSVVFEVALPSLKTREWPVPDFGSINQSGRIHFAPARDAIFVVKDESFLATGDRKTREWKLNREVQPFGEPARVGDELFFLTQAGGARGMASLSLHDQAITVLASNRRTPPKTPLDRPDISARYIKAGDGGLIEITTEPFDTSKREPEDPDKPYESKPQSLVTYDPVKRVWTEPKRIEETAGGPAVFTPLVAAGTRRAYKKQPNSNVWTLQLPRAEMPKARIPIEFAAPEGMKAEEATPSFGGFGAAQWYWTPQGYIVTVSPAFKTTAVYFIPQTELDAWLDAHVPGEDETGGVPPAPTKR